MTQKSGKSLFFRNRNKNESLAFGLFFNPAALLFCFYQYVYPVINKIQRKVHYFFEEKLFILEKAVYAKTGKTQLLKTIIKNDRVSYLEDQGVHPFDYFFRINALIYTYANIESLGKGDYLKVQILTQN